MTPLFHCLSSRQEERMSPDTPRLLGNSRAGCCPRGPFSPSSFIHLQARSLSECPWGAKQAPTPGSPRRAAAELGTNVTASIPCLKPPIPTGPRFVPAERSPGSSPHRAGTRHATAWHVFPGLPKQPQKHNKQQQHTADSRQTFPSYFLPSSVCAFSPLPQGSCCHRKGTTILFEACAIPAGAAVQSPRHCQEGGCSWGGAWHS